MRAPVLSFLFSALLFAVILAVEAAPLPDTGDTGDSGGVDSGLLGDSGADTGVDTADDTGSSATDDTAESVGAAQLAGEVGGCGCNVGSAPGLPQLMLPLGLLLLVHRRRR